MIIRKALVALAATSLVLGSSAAAAVPAPTEETRVGSPVKKAEGIRGWFWLLLIAAAIGFGIYKLTNDSPASP